MNRALRRIHVQDAALHAHYADELLYPEHLFNILVDGKRVEGDPKR